MASNRHPLPTQFSISRRAFLRLGLGALAGGLYTTKIEPGWIEVTRPYIHLAHLPAALRGFKIAQLSDLHAGPYVDAAEIRHSVAIANSLGADLMVLTGDFVSRSASFSKACAQELAALRAPYGLYAVLGNHDIWTDPDEIAGNLSDAGIVVLRDARQAIQIGTAQLWLLGIEDTGFLSHSFKAFRSRWLDKAAKLAELLLGIPPQESRILLVHNPDFTEMLFTEMLPAGRIDLALCGHTHGGQVRLPIIGPPFLPSCMGQKFAGGLVYGPHTPVYVNRGIGVISPPVRFNCRPEITLIELERG
ncbi:MAG: metallophosphoesterase [Chloroflexi bacterium]|nr:metallophosphoesterase [Chloroflexota bacterium]